MVNSVQMAFDLALYRVQTFNFLHDHSVRVFVRDLGNSARGNDPSDDARVEQPFWHPYFHPDPQDCRDYMQCHDRVYGTQPMNGSGCGEPALDAASVCGQCFYPLDQCGCGFADIGEGVDLSISTQED